MVYISKSFRTTIRMLGVLLFLVSSNSSAATIRNVQFTDTVIVEQTVLKIRGVAILKWAMFFDVYAGAFYMPKDGQSQAWNDDVPKRLELAYLREIKASDIAVSSEQLLKRNLSSSEYNAVAERLQKFLGLFRDVKPGDRYCLTYSPGQGTELRLNNEALGVVPGADFAVAYFGIWLGKNPISQRFRARLLGS